MQDSKTFIEELEMPIAKFNPVSYDDTLMNKIVGNPIHVFQLLKRLTQKLEDITKWIKKGKNEIHMVIMEKGPTIYALKWHLNLGYSYFFRKKNYRTATKFCIFFQLVMLLCT